MRPFLLIVSAYVPGKRLVIFDDKCRLAGFANLFVWVFHSYGISLTAVTTAIDAVDGSPPTASECTQRRSRLSDNGHYISFFWMSGVGYFPPSAAVSDHDRFTPQSRHRVISRQELRAKPP